MNSVRPRSSPGARRFAGTHLVPASNAADGLRDALAGFLREYHPTGLPLDEWFVEQWEREGYGADEVHVALDALAAEGLAAYELLDDGAVIVYAAELCRGPE